MSADLVAFVTARLDEDEPPDECDGADRPADAQVWTARTCTLAETADASLPSFPGEDFGRDPS